MASAGSSLNKAGFGFDGGPPIVGSFICAGWAGAGCIITGCGGAAGGAANKPAGFAYGAGLGCSFFGDTSSLANKNGLLSLSRSTVSSSLPNIAIKD